VLPRCLAILLAAAAPSQQEPGPQQPGPQQPGPQQHWAYRPVVRPELPAGSDEDCLQALDRFVRRDLAARGLEPAPPADRATWLRRVSLDLCGLPPTPDEVAAFAADASPEAFERQVDRLLQQPAFGERWAAWWLDLARYADSQGYEKDGLRPHMWRWRDWVIAAFARDLPFDQFTVEQLAGDLLPGATLEQQVATAFHRNTMTNTEGGTDDEEFRTAAVIDRVNTTMTVWMGSTLGCAQCHDHKYDPFSQREYFQLFAFFDQTEDADRDDEAPTLRAPTQEQQQRLLALDAEIDACQAPAAAGDRLAALQREREAIAVPLVPVLRELPAERRRTTRVHLRGSFLTPGDAVSPAVPACWPTLPADAPRTRLGLARWLVSRDNPLTARVQVNRAWEQLFGRGLVATLEDFGQMGERPSHRELLDWLASDFMDDGWSWRRLLRRIVLSATYRQASTPAPDVRARDRDNAWLARGPGFRLSGEMLRDQALHVSGLLHASVGGPSVMPEQPDGIWGQIYSGEKWHTSAGPARHRRSLYTFWRRTSPHPAMTTFDAPSRELCVVRRVRTNTPLQALVTWNDPQFVECARALAARVLLEVGGDDAARLERMFRLCLLRAPDDAERQRLLAFVQLERDGGEGSDQRAWERCASVLLNLDEFLTKG
jgi:hypothetical protein